MPHVLVRGVLRYSWLACLCGPGWLVGVPVRAQMPTVYVEPSVAYGIPGGTVTFEYWIKAAPGTEFDLRAYQVITPCELALQSGWGTVDYVGPSPCPASHSDCLAGYSCDDSDPDPGEWLCVQSVTIDESDPNWVMQNDPCLGTCFGFAYFEY